MEIYLQHSIGKKKGLTSLWRGESARPGSYQGKKGRKGIAGRRMACTKADVQGLLRVVYSLEGQ